MKRRTEDEGVVTGSQTLRTEHPDGLTRDYQSFPKKRTQYRPFQLSLLFEDGSVRQRRQGDGTGVDREGV